HPTGRWCKKIKIPHGWKIFYFGPVGDWKAALARYQAEIDDLKLGRVPAARSKDGLRPIDLLNRFLHFKRGLVQAGELTTRSWDDYHWAGQRLLKVFGQDKLVEDLAPEDPCGQITARLGGQSASAMGSTGGASCSATPSRAA